MLNDTHYGMKWGYFHDILKGLKFEKVFSYNFTGISQSNLEEFAIFANREKGYLLHAETYQGEGVNTTKLHFELAVPNLRESKESLNEYREISNGCSSSGTGEGIVCLERDAREGLAGYIQKLEDSSFKTNNPWGFYDNHWIWLCDYMEVKQPSYDHDAIRLEKVSKFPEDIQKMIGFKKD